MAGLASMKLLSDLVAENGGTIPDNYVRPPSDRPNLHEVETLRVSIPVIDLQGLKGSSRHEVVKAIGMACESDGFFQVKNHGIPESVIERMLHVSKEFFQLPERERMRCYSSDPMKETRLSTSFNVNTEKVRSWRDYLRLHCYPLEDFVHDWPSNPPSFRDDVGEYCKNARELALRLLEAISESLGLQGDSMSMALGSKHAQHMAINYYPPCPQPELTYGLPGHKDPNVITILLQDGVPGLQVLRNGKWVAVDAGRGELVINIGDQMQVLSNGRYKSILHRAIVNSTTERISIPTFYSPSPDAVIKPPESLVGASHPALYRSYSYAEYYAKFWSQGLNTESCLDMFKAM
ncbi:protein DMR6-LIKE OXYGENASE 2-like [Iris pallida]|uniref:Protein DMR6-LIKE OXYGENASE 2-like n=1 Tax=Iris pallida TaxID=29817 RepID=A0AAX6IBG0_IRIPA|nr:protein DMR6-LIKE OXYGENASE 2-like [Iris pallida]